MTGAKNGTLRQSQSHAPRMRVRPKGTTAVARANLDGDTTAGGARWIGASLAPSLRASKAANVNMAMRTAANITAEESSPDPESSHKAAIAARMGNPVLLAHAQSKARGPVLVAASVACARRARRTMASC